MPPEDLNTLIGQYLSGGQVNPNLLGLISAGVGRTDLSPLLSNVGLGAVTGGIDPVALQQAMQASVNQQASDYLAGDYQKRMEYEAGVPAVPSIEYYRQLLVPRIAGMGLDETAETAVSLAVEGLLSGEITKPEATKAMMDAMGIDATSGLERYTDNAPMLQSISNVNSLLDQAEGYRTDFLKDEKEYTDARFKADTLLRGLGELTPFDREQARRDFYAEAGVPALGYMSDPSAIYQFAPAVVAKAGGKQDIEDFRTQMRKLVPEEPKISPYSFGAEQQSAANRARELQRKYIEGVISKEESKREENSKKLGQALALLGATPFQSELGAMRDFAFREASA